MQKSTGVRQAVSCGLSDRNIHSIGAHAEHRGGKALSLQADGLPVVYLHLSSAQRCSADIANDCRRHLTVKDADFAALPQQSQISMHHNEDAVTCMSHDFVLRVLLVFAKNTVGSMMQHIPQKICCLALAPPPSKSAEPPAANCPADTSLNVSDAFARNCTGNWPCCLMVIPGSF